MTLEPRPQDDPYLLIRGYDLCGRASCQHERRWHAPCTARVGEQDQLGRCGCKLFLDVAALQQQQVQLQAQQTATAGAQAATQSELDAHEAQPDHKTPKVTLLPADVAQDTEPQVLAPDGSVVDPAPDAEVAQDTEAPAVMATAAAAPAPAPKTRARARRVKGR